MNNTTSQVPVAKLSSERTWRCGLYVRVSTDRQASKEFSSLETQEDVLRQFVREKDEQRGRSDPSWRVVRVYSEAKSAKDTNRSVFRELMRDVESGEVNMIVVLALDRFTRSLRDFLNLQDRLHAKGCGFASKRDPMLDTSSLHGELITRILLVLAEYERKLTATRIREKAAWRAQQGLWHGGHVLGYDLSVRPKGTLVVNDAEAEVVRFIFNAYVGAKSTREVARATNANGLRTKRYTARNGREHGGRLFSKITVWNILTSPLYTGKIRHHDQVYAGKHDAIIDDATWNRVQTLLKHEAPRRRSTRHRSRTYLLEGLLECGECGSSFVPHHNLTRGVVRPYYRCRAKYCGARECGVPAVAAGQIEALVMEEVRRLARTPEVLARALDLAGIEGDGAGRAVQKELRGKLADLARLEGEERCLVDVVKAQGAKVPTSLIESLTDTRSRIDVLNEAIVEVKTRASNAKHSSIDRAAIKDGLAFLDRVLDRLKPEEQAELVRTYIQRVTYTPKVVRIYFYDQPETPRDPSDTEKNARVLPGTAGSTSSQPWCSRASHSSNVKPSAGSGGLSSVPNARHGALRASRPPASVRHDLRVRVARRAHGQHVLVRTHA